MKKVLAIIFGIMTVGLTIAVLVVNKNMNSNTKYTADTYSAQYDPKQEGTVADLLVRTAVDRNPVMGTMANGQQYIVQVAYDRHNEPDESGFVLIVYDAEDYDDIQYWEELALDSSVKALRQEESKADELYAGCISGKFLKAEDFGIVYDESFYSSLERATTYVYGIGVNSTLIPFEKCTDYKPGPLVLFIGQNQVFVPEPGINKGLIIGLMVGAVLSMILSIVFTVLELKESR